MRLSRERLLILGTALVSAIILAFLLLLTREEPIEGYDRNHDGVRDDVERYIDSIAKSPKVRAAARELAKNYQRSIVDIKTPHEPGIKAVWCLVDAAQKTGQSGQTMALEIEERVANRQDRIEALIRYSTQFDGQVVLDPDRFDIPCVDAE